MNRQPAALRLSILAIAVSSLFVALFARLVYLQVIDSPQLVAAAKANQVRTVYEEAPRGRILDRNGKVLAGNKEVDVITVTRQAATADPTLLARLAQFLGVDAATLHGRMTDPKVSPYKPVPVAEDVDKAVVAAFREHQDEFPGASAETQVRRWYPNGTLAAHVLGYTGEANDRELAAHKDDGYHLGDEIGKTGVEAVEEPALRGKPGVDKIEVDASGRPVRVLSRTAPVPGDDVVLSIDLDAQRAAEASLVQALVLARGGAPLGEPTRGLAAPAGSAVAVDPRDGSVLAMASFPTYDPAGFSKGISADEYARLIDPKGGQPLTNRAIQGQYAPGSTFKLMTSVAALRSNLITPGTVINDTGSFVLGDRRFRNAEGKVYGPIDLPHAITVSSDVYFYTLGDRFWNSRRALGDPIQVTARDFGLGAASGIELSGEALGRVPDPASRKKLHDQHPDAFPEGNWYPGDNVNLAIGQGDTLVTPLQLADAYATFANGGTLHEPHLVARVVDVNGKVVRQSSPRALGQASLPLAVRQPIEQGLEGVVSDPRGTAYSAFSDLDLRAFPVAGKTGTAQVAGKDDTGLFAGYGPVGSPRVAVGVVLEQAGFGSASAAPVAERIMAAIAGQPVTPIRLGTGGD